MHSKNQPLPVLFFGWTENWEKDKWKTNGAANKVLFSNKYKELCFIFPDTGHIYYICEEDIVFQRCCGWVIYAQCDVTGDEDDQVATSLAATLIHKNPQANGVKVMHPEECSDCNRVCYPVEQ